MGWFTRSRPTAALEERLEDLERKWRKLNGRLSRLERDIDDALDAVLDDDQDDAEDEPESSPPTPQTRIIARR